MQRVHFLFVLIFTLIISCRGSKVEAADFVGDGTSMATAVVVTEKKSESAIFVEEKEWLNLKYPGYTIISSTVPPRTSEKIYDLIKIKISNGQTLDIYFDVSIFYNN